VDTLELQVLIAQEIHLALGGEGSALQSERAENLKYYLGDKFGNEQDGRSQVVSSDVADTIEWMLPQLMRILASSDTTVSFEPVGAEDIEAAEQATQYVNHIWNADNDGFLNFYTWFKDALLSKNGFIKVWWDERVDATKESYEALSDEEMAFIVNDQDVEIVGHTEQYVPVGPNGELGTSHDLDVARSATTGGVRIEPVPPEEFLISREAKSIQDARFVGHRQRRTLSSLIAEGFSRDLVEDLVQSNQGDTDVDSEVLARDTFLDEHEKLAKVINNDAMREVWVVECYVRVDQDDDGIAEMRQITVAGPNSDILSDVPWDGPAPFASLTPINMPHRFYGRAIADLVKDLQLIKSTIMRQYLDGLYLANNPRQEAVEANIVEPSELLASRPGGIVRVKERGSISPISTPFIGAQALEGLQYTDQMRENRTGVSPRTQGLGANPLHATASGERLMYSAAQGKLELIARIFAETGVKQAFKIILWLVSHYQDKERIIRLRNTWVPMDPRNWSSEMDIRVSVGLGTGDKQGQLTNAITLLELQKQALEVGFATPQNLMETAEIVVGAMGLKGVERFFTLPDPNNPHQGLPGKGAVPNEAQAIAMQQVALTQNQAALEQANIKSQLEARTVKAQQDRELKELEIAHKFELDQVRLENELALKREEFAAEMQIKREVATQELLLKMQKDQMNAQGKSCSCGSDPCQCNLSDPGPFWGSAGFAPLP